MASLSYADVPVESVRSLGLSNGHVPGRSMNGMNGGGGMGGSDHLEIDDVRVDEHADLTKAPQGSWDDSEDDAMADEEADGFGLKGPGANGGDSFGEEDLDGEKRATVWRTFACKYRYHLAAFLALIVGSMLLGVVIGKRSNGGGAMGMGEQEVASATDSDLHEATKGIGIGGEGEDADGDGIPDDLQQPGGGGGGGGGGSGPSSGQEVAGGFGGNDEPPPPQQGGPALDESATDGGGGGGGGKRDGNNNKRSGTKDSGDDDGKGRGKAGAGAAAATDKQSGGGAAAGDFYSSLSYRRNRRRFLDMYVRGSGGMGGGGKLHKTAATDFESDFERGWGGGGLGEEMEQQTGDQILQAQMGGAEGEEAQAEMQRRKRRNQARRQRERIGTRRQERMHIRKWRGGALNL